ncbi:hypothetical protein [Actinomadura rupiterrae]|uniref:hypothetical protein n=1 Tax=Actinomadura rupiterrae TaxID=559627 RepID=UPI0020A3477C|nr:hypothetical protein [Actinomadura rupiterrae]MCP2343263.1 hypothetical protein [Actinomadura rupiterrae]
MLDQLTHSGAQAAARAIGHPATAHLARHLLAHPALAEQDKPAGGAAVDQVFIASGAAAVLTAVLLVLGWGHRSGRLTWLTRAAALAERGPGRGLPGWAALPTAFALGSLLTALLGMYWDISLHISHGRDVGPLANIAHYPILLGLFGIFTSGVLAVVLPLNGERPGTAAVRITRTWYAPAGGVLLAGTGFYALLGFPLDDVWHRIFGQDVTLWGPTHLMLIGGAGLSLVAMMILEREGRRAHAAAKPAATGSTTTGEAATGGDVRPDAPAWLRWVRRGMLSGGLLIGLSVFQAEYDFGVPQFRLVHQPLLIAVAAGCALVCARLWAGRGAALFATAFYMLVRGGVSLVVAGVIGELWAAVPLYFAEALCVEIAALALARRPLALGAVSGVLIGTAGFAAEFAWTHLAFRLPWTGDIAAEGAAMAVVGGVAGGLCGALLAEGLQGRLPGRRAPGRNTPALARTLFAASLAAFAAAMANCQVFIVPHGQTATLTLTGVHGTGLDRTADVRLELTPRTGIDHPSWVAITAWQGKGLHVEQLHKDAPGVYRTRVPAPIGGQWKTLIRFHDGRELAAVPVYLPHDKAINAPELPAQPHVTRPVTGERHILQRELKTGLPPWLWAACSAVVLACTLILLISLGWGVARIARILPEPARPARTPEKVGT